MTKKRSGSYLERKLQLAWEVWQCEKPLGYCWPTGLCNLTNKLHHVSVFWRFGKPGNWSWKRSFTPSWSSSTALQRRWSNGLGTSTSGSRTDADCEPDARHSEEAPGGQLMAGASETLLCGQSNVQCEPPPHAGLFVFLLLPEHPDQLEHNTVGLGLQPLCGTWGRSGCGPSGCLSHLCRATRTLTRAGFVWVGRPEEPSGRTTTCWSNQLQASSRIGLESH